MPFLNADGTTTLLQGSELDVNQSTPDFLFRSGRIDLVTHYDSNGVLLDYMTDLVHPGTSGNNLRDVIAALQSGLDTGNPRFLLTDTDDLIDARYRLNNVIIDDVFYGYGDNDEIYGGSGNDKLFGGSDDDYLNGGTGHDLLVGGGGSDYIDAGAGNDKLIAEALTVVSGDGGSYYAFDDQLFGGTGNDLLMGGRGNDIMIGGAGRDTAILRGSFASLNIVNWGNGFQVSGHVNGTDDWLEGIERIACDDGTWAFSAATQTWSKINASVGQALVAPEQGFQGGTWGRAYQGQ